MKKKNLLYVVLLSFCLVSFFSCKADDENDESNTEHTEKNDTGKTGEKGNTTVVTTKIGSEFWGTWIQMNTGTEYYIDDTKVYTVSVSGNKTEFQSGIGEFKLESNEVMKNGNLAYFRKGGSKRSFSVGISGFASTAARGISIGTQDISGRRKNKKNTSDTQTTSVSSTSETDGTITFTDAVPDDTQTVEVVTKDDTVLTTTDVTPQYDGENVGTIPLVEAGKYALKTSYVINTKLEDYMYGNNYAEYDITLKIENISKVICATSFYTISCDDQNLTLSGIPTTGNIRSLAAGDTKELRGTVSYGTLTEDYKDVTLKITIEDVMSDDTWNDSVTLRFYRGRVPLVINAALIDSTENANLNGFIIYPDGRSRWFDVAAGQNATVWMPYSQQDYVIVFSGATTTSEMKYSFNFRNLGKLADLSGTASRDELKGYEPNDTFATAYNLGDVTENVKGALHYGDLDYYKINNKNQLIGNLASIRVDSSAMRTNYYLNQTLDTTGLVVKAVYQAGEEVDVSSSVVIGDVDMTTTGTKSIEVSYTEDNITKTEKIYVTVNDFTATGITIAKLPAKNVYYTEQEFDSAGILVNATTADGETIDVTNSVEYSGFDNTTVGMQTITVSLTNDGSRHQDTFLIEMRQLVLESIRIDSKPTKQEYYSGQRLNKAGLKVTALYNSGEEKDCTEKVTDDFDSSNATASLAVTLSYIENGVTKTASFNVIVNSLPNNLTIKPVKIADESITKNLSLGTEGTYYYFGDWPQAQVDNPPVNEEDGPAYNDWYIGDDGNFYAKAVAKGESNYDYQNYGFTSGKTYWFKVQPIRWRMLTNNYNGTGKALLLSESILTDQPWSVLTDSDWYYSSGTLRAKNKKYKYSNIRAYLNGSYEADDEKEHVHEGQGLLQKAFTSNAQNRIAITLLNDSEVEDKIFLLSRDEVLMSDFGFSTYQYENDKARRRLRAAYAHATRTTFSEMNYTLHWYLRDELDSYPTYVCGHNGYGPVSPTDYNYPSYSRGIVPALCVELDN